MTNFRESTTEKSRPVQNLGLPFSGINLLPRATPVPDSKQTLKQTRSFSAFTMSLNSGNHSSEIKTLSVSVLSTKKRPSSSITSDLSLNYDSSMEPNVQLLLPQKLDKYRTDCLEENTYSEIFEHCHKKQKSLQTGVEKRAEYDVHMSIKIDHDSRLIWVTSEGLIILENFRSVDSAKIFLSLVAEPVTRPSNIHEYMITPYSLYAAASSGLSADDIISKLDKLCKSSLPEKLVTMIRENMKNYGKLKLILNNRRYFVETSDSLIRNKILNDHVARSCISDLGAKDKNYLYLHLPSRRSETTITIKMKM